MYTHQCKSIYALYKTHLNEIGGEPYGFVNMFKYTAIHLAFLGELFSANGHIMLNAPVLVRSLKLSSIEPC